MALSELHEFIFSLEIHERYIHAHVQLLDISSILTWKMEQSSWPVFQPFWNLESTAWLQQWAVCQAWSWPNFWTTSSGYLADWIAQHIQDSWWWIRPCLDSPSPVFQSVQPTWNLQSKVKTVNISFDWIFQQKLFLGKLCGFIFKSKILRGKNFFFFVLITINYQITKPVLEMQTVLLYLNENYRWKQIYIQIENCRTLFLFAGHVFECFLYGLDLLGDSWQHSLLQPVEFIEAAPGSHLTQPHKDTTHGLEEKYKI